MNKINKYIFLMIILLVIFTACYKSDIVNNKQSKDRIQLWYTFGIVDEESYNRTIIKNAKEFCDRNNIPLDIVKFDSEILSYEDYAFKRNLAAKDGNMIIIDSISRISDLAKNHADYTKLKIYNNLLDPYKNRFCIPIGRTLKSSFINNEILQYYGIDSSQKPVLTYTDYLEIKQEMKKKGARFSAKNEDFYETVRYYLNSNGLLYVNRQSDILKDNDKFKEALKNTIFGMCQDIILYNDTKLNEFERLPKVGSKGFELYDSNSLLYLKEVQNSEFYWAYPYTSKWFRHSYIYAPLNKTYIIDYFGVNSTIVDFMPTNSLYIYKKITNEKIYDLANYMLNLSSYLYGRNDKLISAPIIYTDRVKKELKLDEKLEYIGISSEDEKKIIDATYNIFIKDEIKSKEIADAYFTDNDIIRSIETLIYDTIYEIAKELSEGKSRDNLSLENFDSENEEINKVIDKKIDEFIKQLILQNI